MSEELESPECKIVEHVLRESFRATVACQVQRHMKAKVHNIIPLDFFSAASAECKDMYVAGSFYGCITLCQSVAEGLSKFLAEKNTVRLKESGGFKPRVGRLKKADVISEVAANALDTIHGEDRNRFHHLNKEVEQDCRKLEERALECLDALYTVESEVFAYDVDDGRIKPKNKKYWPSEGEGTLSVDVRFG